MWSEIQQVQELQRHELVLTGAEIAQRIAENGLDEHLYNLVTLNFLEISKTTLSTLDERIGQLKNLTRLVLHYNKLKEIPDTLGNLTKLKFLDVSHNELTELPEVFSTLTELHSINASVNQLVKIADLSQCVHLTYVDFSYNKLEEFPENLCSIYLINLLEIKLNCNEIRNISSKVVFLSGLKQLHLSKNKIRIIPKEVSQCLKLKEIFLEDNSIEDSRLNKLTKQKPQKFKAILDYIQQNCFLTEKKTPTNEKNAAEKKPKTGKTKNRNTKKGEEPDEGGEGGEGEELRDEIVILQGTDDSKRVVVKPTVISVRPYIVCCIVRNLQLNVPAKLKKFISIQTELHDDLCDKRMAATIATHDLDLIQGDMTYEARPPRAIKLQPLKRSADVTAEALVNHLREEADALRKEKKRNTYSGIHKYLNLLQDKTTYPCLVSGDGTVISFPPITNSDKTKISSSTKNVLVEVTSSKSLAVCKTVMDRLLTDCLKEGLTEGLKADTQSEEKVTDGMADLTITQTQTQTQTQAETQTQTQAQAETQTQTQAQAEVPKRLVIEQVKIFDESGELRVVYPSRVDLDFPHLNIVRS